MKRHAWFGMVVMAGALGLAGCSTVNEIIADWQAAVTNAPAVPPAPDPAPDPVPDTPPDPAPVADPAADAVQYSLLHWSFGGFKGAGAAVDVPRIEALRVNNSGLSYRWASGDLSAWGLDNGDAGALACLFVQRTDGSWHGGKFDWISSSRTSRSFTNVHGGYGGWTLDGVPTRCQAAFVIVSRDGRRRTNVIASEWSR